MSGEAVLNVKQAESRFLSRALLLPTSRPVVPAVDAAAAKEEAGVNRFLLLLSAAFLILYGCFYPTLYTSIDEASNFSMAYVLRTGTIYPGAGFFPSLSPFGPHGVVYRFPIGFPSLLALVSFVGWRAFFLVNPLLHVAAAWCFARLLREMRIDPRFAALYLLYPGFVLFTRTLFADTLAASLTTIALFLLMRRRGGVSAGLCLGLALTARSASAVVAGLLLVGLLVSDWKQRKTVPWHGARALRFGLGLLPFVLVNLAYNFFTMGSPFKSTYNPGDLTWHGLLHSGRLYALSLLLLYPGLLLAPFFYRGPFWRQGLIACVLTTLIAAAYDQSTYGNSFAQTVLATPRQILPILPFFLLAFCALLSRFLGPRVPVRGFAVGACALLLAAAGISFQHQKYLRQLAAVQQETVRLLPPGCTVYANKDIYKLHQRVWDERTYRELPFVTPARARADLATARLVFVAVHLRSRGVEAEDAANQSIRRALAQEFILSAGPASATGEVTYYRVDGVKEK